MISQRQINILNRIPTHHGKTRLEFKELERMLERYSYTEQELDVIEKGFNEFEAYQQAKFTAKLQLREKLKKERLAKSQQKH